MANATVSLRVLRSDGSSLTSTKTTDDANITRIINAMAAILGTTPQGVLDQALSIVVQRWGQMTTNNEQAAVVVTPIVFT